MTGSQTNSIQPPTLWLIDDDPSLRIILEDNFTNAGIKVITFANAHGAWTRLNEWQNNTDKTTEKPTKLPNAILTDIRMPMMDGLSFSDWLNREFPDIPIIIMTAHSDLQSAIDSYQTGAFEYLPKPFDLDEATAIVKKAIKRNLPIEPTETETETQAQQTTKITSNSHATKQPSPELHNRGTANKEKDTSTNPNGIIGQSIAMQNVFRAIGKLAQSPITVLITGESGTGKELVANALHQTSPRQDKPFIALNMSAIPHELIESELFGHEKGAFTGATSARKGHFEQADGGTLFLDEIGDMPYNTQTRLLRVLANGEFFRVGGKTPIKVDVRIISATHQNLEQLVKQGKFREDLFYRINVIRLPLPALRERNEDIPSLTEHFLKRTAKELNTSLKTLHPSAMQLMQNYTWPGNVRQLENACRWISVMASGNLVYNEDLPPELLTFSTQNTPPTRPDQRQIEIHSDSLNTTSLNANNDSFIKETTWEELLTEWTKKELTQGRKNLLNIATPNFEQVMINTALLHCKGNKGKASELLGWGRNTLTRKIQQLGLDDRW